MKRILLAILYTVAVSGANPLFADIPALLELRQGNMKKLVFADAPKPASRTAWQLADGAGSGSLADHRGQYVLLNFWATWCAPCREEMPTLSALQREFGGESFQVVTVATGRNPPQAIDRFFDEAGIDNLPRHRDPHQALARNMAVLGLPATVLVDPDGNEIARLLGDADWHSDSARAIVAALLAESD